MILALILLYVTAIVASIFVGFYLIALALFSRAYSKNIEGNLN